VSAEKIMRELFDEDDKYECCIVPVPPYVDEADQRAAFGAALVRVTHMVLGIWPDPAAVKQAVDLLSKPRGFEEKRKGSKP
jgi:hypothetical protein